MPALLITREELSKLYFDEMQSTCQIARKYGVKIYANTITSWLHIGFTS